MSTIRIQPPFDIQTDFWTKNFPLKFVSPFDELYEDKGHEESSRFMWCLWLLEHPSTYNPFRNLDRAEKVESIRKYVDWFDPEDEFQKSCINKFNHVCLTLAAKGFKGEDETLIKRQEMVIALQDRFSSIIEEDPLMLRNRETIALMKYLEDMRKNTAKVYEGYEEARKVFEQEEEELIIHGGGRESIVESGGLLEIKDD